jgi:NAD(P)-dependent dehydrogenase (short-subunit alcohol dehydrogenase family)
LSNLFPEINPNLGKDAPMSVNPNSNPNLDPNLDPNRTNQRFAGKVAVITGGAGGLGLAIGKAFCREGGIVALFDANPEAVEAATMSLEEAGFTASGECVDVRDSHQVQSAMARIANRYGQIDSLIAAAGGSLGTPRDLEDISPEDLDLVIDVNIKGTYHCSAAVVPFMRSQGGGSIVTFSSIGGRSTSPVTGIPYAAAKAGILGLTRRLAREVGPDNIRVNAIAPGLFLTGRLQGMFDAMTEKDRNEVLDSIPLHRMPDIHECVEPVLFLASDASSYITGIVLDVNGGRFMAG